MEIKVKYFQWNILLAGIVCYLFALFILLHKTMVFNKESFARFKNNKIFHKAENLASFKSPNKFAHLFMKWTQEKREFCQAFDTVTLYGGMLLTFQNVSLNPAFAHGINPGGENISSVIGQDELLEQVTIDKGFFTINCNESLQNVIFAKKVQPHFKEWIKLFKFSDNTEQIVETVPRVKELTIAVKRYEYANVYWVLMDLYNVFLITQYYNKSSKDTNILLFDAKPHGHLDGLWYSMFKSVQRPHTLHGGKTLYERMAWLFSRSYSPLLDKTLPTLPFLNEFRETILKSQGLHDSHVRKCKELYVLFVRRRNYVAHPRNPSGFISRKIRNEKELLNASKTSFPRFHIRSAQLDKLSIREQLRIISQTDILIGMHGAAMAMSLFMPHGGAVIELWPQYQHSYNWHMESIARWRGHRFYSWRNKNQALEDATNGYTTVPPHVVLSKLANAYQDLCFKKLI